MKLYSIMKGGEEIKRSYYKTEERAEEVLCDMSRQYKGDQLDLYAFDGRKWQHVCMEMIIPARVA